MTINVLNTEFIKRRRVELGLSNRQLAAAAGTSNNGLNTLEPGTHQDELTIGFLAKLARALACEIPDLINPSEPDIDQPLSEDAAVLGQILHTTKVLTPIATLAEITGWNQPRLDTALEQLASTLPNVGLTLHKLGSKVALRAGADLDGDLVAAATRSHINRDGLDLSEIRLLRRILDGNCPTQPGNAETVALGVLANARLIEPDGPGGWKAHPDVLFSLAPIPQGKGAS